MFKFIVGFIFGIFVGMMLMAVLQYGNEKEN